MNRMVFLNKFKNHRFLGKLSKFTLNKSDIEFPDSYKHLSHTLVLNRCDIDDKRR